MQAKLPPQHMSRNQKRIAARNEKKATATNKANAAPAPAALEYMRFFFVHPRKHNPPLNYFTALRRAEAVPVGPVPDGYVPVQLGALAI